MTLHIQYQVKGPLWIFPKRKKNFVIFRTNQYLCRVYVFLTQKTNLALDATYSIKLDEHNVENNSFFPIQ